MRAHLAPASSVQLGALGLVEVLLPAMAAALALIVGVVAVPVVGGIAPAAAAPAASAPVSYRPATHFATGTRPITVAVGDLNGDAKPDLATANPGSDNVSVLLGTDTGGFGPATHFATATSNLINGRFLVAVGSHGSAVIGPQRRTATNALGN